jgi:hypothetical protein
MAKVFLGLPHLGVKVQFRFPNPSEVNVGVSTVDPFTAGLMYRVTVRPGV